MTATWTPTSRQHSALRSINRELRHRDVDWWIDNRRIHPERQVKVPVVRGPDAEVIAKQFFETVAKDPGLLSLRAGILLTWHEQRKKIDKWRELLNEARQVKGQ